MRISKGIVVLLAGLVTASVAQVSLAQDDEEGGAGTASISPEKKSPLLTLMPTLYGKVDLQHRTMRSYNDDGTYGNTEPFYLVHPILGATFFNDHLDTAFHWYFQNIAGSNRVSKWATYNETQWNWWQGKFNEESPWSFGPYAYVDLLTTGDQGYDYADVGFYGEVNYTFPIKSGSISVQFSEQPLIEVAPKSATNYNYSSSGPGEYNPSHAGGSSNKAESHLGLVDHVDDEGQVTTHQQDYTYLNYAGVNVKYTPAALPNFSAGLGIIATSYWFPEYNLKPDGTQELRGYNPQQFTTNRVILSYNITDKVTISEQLRYYKGGYDQWTITNQRQDMTNWEGPYSWENRVGVVATLW